MNVYQRNTTVIKVGTDVCTTKEGRLDEKIIHTLLDQIMRIKHELGQVFLVTSGAVASGRELHGVTKTDNERDDLKGMWAACGQPRLMHIYNEYLKRVHNCIGYQFLLTPEVFASKKRRNTLLRRLGSIPQTPTRGLAIFNENDAISNDEIKFTDNDHLTKDLANLVHAKTVILLTGEVHGVQRDVNDPATVIPEITLDRQAKFKKFVVSSKTKNGTGGMPRKYGYACELARSGITTHIANGKIDNILTRILLDKESIGTVFSPKDSHFT